MGQVALEPAWDEPHHLSLRIGVSGLFGALVVQLALAIAKTDGLTLRSACGMTYLPGRRPNPKRRRYCSPCRAGGAPLRDAAADYRRPPVNISNPAIRGQAKPGHRASAQVR